MIDSDRPDARADSERADSGGANVVADGGAMGPCTKGPKFTVTNGVFTDETRAFQLTVPTGFAAKPRACGDYPALEQVVPDANRQPGRVDIYVTDNAFAPRDLPRAVNGAGVAYYLVPGRGQESGEVSDWSLVIPAASWFITFQTDGERKSVLEQIASTFHWMP